VHCWSGGLDPSDFSLRIDFEWDTTKPPSVMAVFREARRLLFSQLINERLKYPFRVAANRGSFYATFRAELTDAEKKEIQDAARYVCERINTLPLDRPTHGSVAECKEAMNLILADG
jgi:hypothetical protein